MRIPEQELIELVIVKEGFDAADDWIVEHVNENDIAVTSDIIQQQCFKYLDIVMMKKDINDGLLGQAMLKGIVQVFFEQVKFIKQQKNPAGVVDGFRWALLGSGTGPGITLWVSATISVLILISGLVYFRSMEKTFADTI
jgi:hypothetical protein